MSPFLERLIPWARKGSERTEKPFELTPEQIQVIQDLPPLPSVSELIKAGKNSVSTMAETVYGGLGSEFYPALLKSYQDSIDICRDRAKKERKKFKGDIVRFAVPPYVEEGLVITKVEGIGIDGMARRLLVERTIRRKKGNFIQREKLEMSGSSEDAVKEVRYEKTRTIGMETQTIILLKFEFFQGEPKAVSFDKHPDQFEKADIPASIHFRSRFI